MNVYEKRDTAFRIMELIKSGELNESQRKQVYDIIMGLQGRTIQQRERVIKLYNLDITQKQTYTKTSLAKEYQCAVSTITNSVYAVQGSLFRIPDEKVLILQKIIKECEK